MRRAAQCHGAKLSNWMVRLLGLVDRPARSIAPQLGREVRFDTSATKQDLALSYRPASEAV